MTGPIIRRFGGNNINVYRDTVRTLRFAGQELFITWTPTTPNGSTTLVPDSGFSFRWTIAPAMYGPPKASFIIPDTVYSGYALRVRNTTTGVRPVYAWDLNGDGIYGLDNPTAGVDSITTNPTITFGTLVPVQRRMCLKASNCAGVDTSCKQFWVLPVTNPPVANFTVSNTTGFTTDTFQLFDLSTNGPNQWRWRFEPNNVTFVPGFDTTSQNPRLFFNAPQSYNVTLIAINSEGQSQLRRTNVVTARAYASPNSIFNPSAVQVDVGITRVRVDTMDCTTALKTPIYHALFNTRKIFVYRGATYNMSISRPTASDGQHMRVWVDWNRDADFDDNNETILSEDNQFKAVTTGTLTVPNNAPINNTRLRVGVAADFSTLFTATSATLGLYEDYGVEVLFDPIKPVVTLKGTAVTKTEIGKPYTDLGATAMDNIEGDISNRIVRIGTVDTSVLGYYTIKYVVTDNYGNVSDTVYRTVQVEVNQTGPTLNVLGGDTLYLEVLKDTFVEPGYNAFSNTGSNITGQVVVTGNIDTTTLGTYFRQYSITDAFGFNNTKRRIVIVRDTEKPKISTITGRDTVDHQINTVYNDEVYVQATDNYWGISSSQLQRTGNVNVNQQGIYTIRYNVADGSGNQANEYTLRVFVRDLIPPVITLIGAPEMTIDVFKNFSDPGVTLSDNNSTPQLTISGSVNINIVGKYNLTYTATDAAGNTATVQRIVNVVDRQAPTMKLLGSNPLRVDIINQVGPWWSVADPGVVASDNYDQPSEIRILIDSSAYVKDVPGDCYIFYTAVDSSGNRSEPMFREVQVRFPVGIKELNQNNTLTVYPNPSTGIFYINSKELKGATITVYDMTGREVLTQQISEGAEDTAIDMTGKMQGMYHMVLTHNGQSYHAKVTVMK
jgi:PKD repeat protein